MRGHFRDGNRETSGLPEKDGPAEEGEQPKLRMNGPEESDNRVVPEKWANKTVVEATEAESMEGRRLAKGNAEQDAVNRTQGRKGSSNGLQGVREVARKRKWEKFTALLHHVNVDLLRASFYRLKKDAAPGVDGETWRQYEVGLEERVKELHDRVHGGTYRAQPSKRAYIPKPGGGMRPLGIAALEDKIVQQAVKEVLTQIYEEDFHGHSYGYRPGRSQHDALDALSVGLMRRVSWVLEADIQGFFDTMDHGWLLKFIQYRVADRRILRLIQKWLRAGVSEEGTWRKTEVGTPQGSVISPLLANIYLHYALDEWVQRWKEEVAGGDVMIVRYADDFVVGFQHLADAERFLMELTSRMKTFGLALHPGKTRIMEFGRYAEQNRRGRGQGKPETFDFLGFTHYCGRTMKGKFAVKRKTVAKRMAAKLAEVGRELKARRHQPMAEVASWLGSVVRGYFNYHAVPGNSDAIRGFRRQVSQAWLRALRRRSQKGKCLSWEKFNRHIQPLLPVARILHPYPNVRFYANHLRQEPCASIAHARICAGGAG